MTDITGKNDGPHRPDGGLPIQAQITPELQLAQKRRSRGFSLEHIAEVTKISVRFLQAIEAEDFAKLPGGVYAVSYVRQYARFVGCDEGLLLERCGNRVSNPETVSSKAAESVLAKAAALPEPRKSLFKLPELPVVRIRVRFSRPRLSRFVRFARFARQAQSEAQ